MAHSKSGIKKAKNLLNKFAPKGEQLAFINPKEANLLKKMGGAGIMTKAGIRSYVDFGSGRGSVSESLNQAADSLNESRSNNGSNNNNNSNDNAPQKKSILSRVGNFIKGAALTALTAATFGVGTLAAIGINKTAQYVTKNINGRITRTRVNAEEARLASAKNNKSFFVPNSDRNYTLDRGIRDNSGGGNNNPAQNVGGRIVKLSPTTAEISQSSATDVTYDSRKTKARGRSMMVRTNSKGIGRNMGSVLGTKSLLGTA